MNDGLPSQAPIQASKLAAFTGDSGSGGAKGVVPAPAAGDAAKFLKGDGTWSNVTSGATLGSNTFTGAQTIALGVTATITPLSITGSVNNYFEGNVQNTSAGTSASSDLVCTASDGTATTFFIDFGINGAGWTGTTWGAARDGYVYVSDTELWLGTNSAGKRLLVCTGGGAAANIRMAVNDNGVGFGVATPASGAGRVQLPTAGTTLVDGVSWSTTTNLFQKSAGTLATDAQLQIDTVGRGITIKEGSNAKSGTALATFNNTGVKGIAFGASTYVAVCTNGNGRILTSSDATTWTNRTAADATVQWVGVAFGAGLFVAISSSGSAGNSVMTSADGITWTLRTAPVSNTCSAIAWNGTVFVVVMSSGTGNRVMTSADGITWTSRTSAADLAWTSVVWTGSIFVAVANSGATLSQVMTSPDGTTWTLRTNATTLTTQFTALAYGSSKYVAVAQSGTGIRVSTSTDAITWVNRTSAADNNWTDVIWNGSIFVAIANSGTGNRVMTSPDGVTWTIRTSAADNSWSSIAWNGTVFCVVSSGSEANGVMTSSDGITWTARTPATAAAWQKVVWNGTVFCAVGPAGTTACVMTSSDGITWTNRTGVSNTGGWKDLVWSGSLFVAAGTNATNPIMTSPDGTTWTARSLPSTFGNGANSVAWDGSKFLAYSANNNVIATSTDGISWIQRQNPLSGFATTSRLYFLNSLYVIVGPSSTDGGTVQTTTDATSAATPWTSRWVSDALPWTSVTFGASTIVAVASNGNSKRVMTSADGITWTYRTNAADNSWQGVAFGNSTFTAIASTGIGNRVMTSADGITWTSRTAVADVNWGPIAYVNSRFLAISTDTAVPFGQTSTDGITWTQQPMAPSSGGFVANTAITANSRIYLSRLQAQSAVTTSPSIIFPKPGVGFAYSAANGDTITYHIMEAA